MMNMKPSKDISDEISKCVEEVTCEIVNSHKTKKGDDSMSSTAELFLKLLPSNLTRAINIVYFNEDDHASSNEMDHNKEMLEYEKAVMDIISKRRQGSTACQDVLQKTLVIEKKTMMEMEVASRVVTVQKYERQSVSYKTDELKLGAKKTLEHLKNSAKEVFDLTDRAEELTKAAIISKEADVTDLESI